MLIAIEIIMQISQRIKKLKLFLLTGLVVFFVSCQGNNFFDEFLSTGDSWRKNDVKTFSFEQKDTVSTYDLFLKIRATNNYPYSNIYLIVTSKLPDNSLYKDTLLYQMASAEGKLLGQGFTDVKTSKLLYKEGFQFSQQGNYQISIEHAMRASNKTTGDEYLNGITDIGLEILKR